VVTYRRLKTTENFKPLVHEVVMFTEERLRLQALRNIVIWLKNFGFVENWLIKSGGRLRGVLATQVSTFFLLLIKLIIYEVIKCL